MLALLAYAGCMAERLKTKLLESNKLVDLVAGPDAYRDLPSLISVVQVRLCKHVSCFPRVCVYCSAATSAIFMIYWRMDVTMLCVCVCMHVCVCVCMYVCMCVFPMP